MTSDSSKNGTRLLDGVRGPADVKAIREQDLPRLAQEVREELIKVLSDAFDVPKHAVSIVSGERNRQKRVRIEGLTDQVVASKLPTKG